MGLTSAGGTCNRISTRHVDELDTRLPQARFTMILENSSYREWGADFQVDDLSLADLAVVVIDELLHLIKYRL